MNELLQDFLRDTSDVFDSLDDQLARFALDPTDQRIAADLFRLIHSVKSAVGFFDFARLEALANAGEAMLASLSSDGGEIAGLASGFQEICGRIRQIVSYIAAFGAEPPGGDEELIALGDAARASAKAAAAHEAIAHMPGAAALRSPGGPPPLERRTQTQRVSTVTLDDILGLACELALLRSQLTAALEGSAGPAAATRHMQDLSRVAARLHDAALKARLQSFSRAAEPAGRLAQKLAPSLGKSTELTLEGGGLLVDRPLFDVVRKAVIIFTHNALTHGIEAPDERLSAGKPPAGQLRIAARSEGGDLVVDVSDDGCGFAEGAHFAAGISGAAQAGLPRAGLSLLLIRSEADACGGSLQIASRPGRGATLTLRLPEALSLTQAVAVRAGSETYLVPKHAVFQILSLAPESGASADTGGPLPILRHAGGALPMADLAGLLGAPPQPTPGADDRAALIIRAGALGYALAVSSVAGMQDIIARPLPKLPEFSRLFSGAALLSGGSPALVLNPAAIGAALGLGCGPASPVLPARNRAAAAPQPRVLVFRSCGGALAALPLSAVLRAERLRRSDIFTTGKDRLAVKLDGKLVPLLDSAGAPAQLAAADAGSWIALAVGSQRAACGLLVNAVHGVEELPAQNIAAAQSKEACGVFALGNESVRLLDLGGLLHNAALGRLDLEDDGANQVRVLLIDAEAITRDMLRLALEAAGCAVLAVDGLAAACGETAPGALCDIVVIDLALALADDAGWARLRGAQAGAAAAAIALCAFASSAARQQARSLRIAETAGKFDRPALIEAVRRQQARLKRQAAAA